MRHDLTGKEQGNPPRNKLMSSKLYTYVIPHTIGNILRNYKRYTLMSSLFVCHWQWAITNNIKWQDRLATIIEFPRKDRP